MGLLDGDAILILVSREARNLRRRNGDRRRRSLVLLDILVRDTMGCNSIAEHLRPC
jgi:hypothetical protein